jgi:hypothetical protein
VAIQAYRIFKEQLIAASAVKDFHLVFLEIAEVSYATVE